MTPQRKYLARAKRSHSRGSALVEFALVVPLFFLIIFAIVELGIIFAGFCGAAYATQVAVRYAIVHGSDSPTSCTAATITTLVARYLWAAQQGSSTITTTWNPNNGAGSTVTVSISLVYQTGIPFSSLSTIRVGTSSQGTVLY